MLHHIAFTRPSDVIQSTRHRGIFKSFAAVEMVFVIKMAVDRDVNDSEFL
jgi:hypothetical protein